VGRVCEEGKNSESVDLDRKRDESGRRDLWKRKRSRQGPAEREMRQRAGG